MVSAHSLDVEIDINVDKTKETSHSHVSRHPTCVIALLCRVGELS